MWYVTDGSIGSHYMTVIMNIQHYNIVCSVESNLVPIVKTVKPPSSHAEYSSNPPWLSRKPVHTTSTRIHSMSLLLRPASYFFLIYPHTILRAASAVCVWADRDSGGSGDGHSPLQRRADPGSGPARRTGLWKGGTLIFIFLTALPQHYRNKAINLIPVCWVCEKLRTSPKMTNSIQLLLKS